MELRLESEERGASDVCVSFRSIRGLTSPARRNPCQTTELEFFLRLLQQTAGSPELSVR